MSPSWWPPGCEVGGGRIRGALRNLRPCSHCTIFGAAGSNVSRPPPNRGESLIRHVSKPLKDMGLLSLSQGRLNWCKGSGRLLPEGRLVGCWYSDAGFGYLLNPDG